MNNNHKKIAIIGAGFSGAMAAIHLIRYADHPLTLYLLDKRGTFAAGVAYSTDNPFHLLNVRAGRMSAYPDQPEHFQTWLHDSANTWRALHPALANLTLGPADFAPRMVFGAYIQDQLARAIEDAPSKACNIQCLAVNIKDIDITDTLCTVSGQGVSLPVDAVILAAGSLPSREYRYEKKLFQGRARFAGNIWAPPAGNILHANGNSNTSSEPVAILGTGLTMIDSIISLRERGYHGKIVAFSRQGRLPAVHQVIDPYPHPWDVEQFPATALGALRAVREEISKAEVQGYHWQSVIDSLRPVTNSLWKRLPHREKRKFLRHLSSLWNVHRHRMPTPSSALIREMEDTGQLKHIKGYIVDTDMDGDHLVISYHERYTVGIKALNASYLLNCAGQETDIGKLMPSHLLYRLREKNYLQEGTLRSGIEFFPDGRAKGDAANYLFVIGPLRSGSLLETVAVPELRQQAQEVAVFMLRFLKERDLNNFTI